MDLRFREENKAEEFMRGKISKGLKTNYTAPFS